MTSLSKTQRGDLARLFEFVIWEAGKGDSWPVAQYVANVQAIVDGQRLEILLDDPEDLSEEEQEDAENFLRQMEDAADEAAAGIEFGGSQ